jgi:hypothetical protein
VDNASTGGASDTADPATGFVIAATNPFGNTDDSADDLFAGVGGHHAMGSGSAGASGAYPYQAGQSNMSYVLQNHYPGVAGTATHRRTGSGPLEVDYSATAQYTEVTSVGGLFGSSARPGRMDSSGGSAGGGVGTLANA